MVKKATGLSQAAHAARLMARHDDRDV